MLTAYDYPTARIVDEAGVPLILVGDSVGMVMLGYEETVRVTMEEMLHHTKAVVRGTRRSLVVGDMPFMSYGVNVEHSLANAARFISEGGAQAVKVEGGVRSARTIEAIARAGIPVMAHIGLTPQAVHGLGGHRVQGKTVESARRLLADAFAVQEAGAFSVVLELVPSELAAAVTERLRIPTIGIGAGAGCSGQVQVITDLLGLDLRLRPASRQEVREPGREDGRGDRLVRRRGWRGHVPRRRARVVDRPGRAGRGARRGRPGSRPGWQPIRVDLPTEPIPLDRDL